MKDEYLVGGIDGIRQTDPIADDRVVDIDVDVFAQTPVFVDDVGAQAWTRQENGVENTLHGCRRHLHRRGRNKPFEIGGKRNPSHDIPIGPASMLWAVRGFGKDRRRHAREMLAPAAASAYPTAMPVEPATLLAFLVTILALVLSVGPDTLLIIRYTMSSGPRTGFSTVMGVQLGLFTHTALAAVGISLVIASSTVAFKTIAVAGAAYLVWLGIQGFRSGLINVEAMTRGKEVAPWRGLRDAMLTNLLNPKVIVLFLALMPNFVDPTRGRVWLQLVTLSVALFVVNVVWQLGVMLLADGARIWLGRPSVQRAVSWSTSAVLFVFAGGLLIDHVL